MHPEQIIGQLLGSLVGRKRKRRSGLLGMAMGRRGRGSLLTGGTLLTAAGLVWGALESMQKSTVPQGGGAMPPAPPPNAPQSGPPPLPSSAGTTTGAGAPPLVPPPLPGAPASHAGPAAAAAVTPLLPLLPLLHLAIDAARADGDLSDEERAVIREQAATLGVAAEVDRALQQRQPLDAIVAAFVTDEQRQAAYAMAYAVIHGDGVESPGERMYLTQLARSLRLPHHEVETIERETLGKE